MTARSAFDIASSYVLYYGHGKEDEISQFDIAILEPAARSREALDCIRSRKDIVIIGYLSALEPQPGEDISGMRAQDLLRVDGTVLEEPVTKNPIFDPRSRRCTDRVIRRTHALMRAGFDGVFVDTIGDVDLPKTRLNDEIMLAARGLVMSIKREWPGAIVCQNSGLERLRNFTADVVDAFCWENYNGAPRTEWFRNVNQWLAGMQGVKKLLLGESPDCSFIRDGDREMAVAGKKPEWLSYLAPKDYVSGVNTAWPQFVRELRC